MEIALLIITSLNLLLIILLFIKIKENKQDKLDVAERLARFEGEIKTDLSEFKYSLSKDLDASFEGMNFKVEHRLNLISDRVNERLDVNFEKSNKTFQNILERLTIIDSAQKKIEELSGDIVSLQSVLTDKKTRGIFGEVNLEHILNNVFGDNRELFQMQYTLSNNTIGDAVVFAPEPTGTIVIDSKFPLENYERLIDMNLSPEERNQALRLFKSDMKKHIDAIADKYIIPGETSDQAILFLPAEAIFAEVNAYHQDLIDYSYQRRVWITSPTTLIAMMTIVEMVVKNLERSKYSSLIHDELNKLGNEFRLYKERWDKLTRSIDRVSEDVKQVNITTDKITKRFNEISTTEIKNELLEENL